MKEELKHTPTILLIDDDEDDCSLFQEAIMEIAPSITLTCLQSTDHLFEAIENTQPVLIFMDFKLPKENGIDCLRRLKAHPVFNTIPVP